MVTKKRRATGLRKKAASERVTKTSRRRLGSSRAKPGTRGGGKYYRIEVRPGADFSSFRYHDVGRPGHVQRLAGRRPNGTWADAAWLIAKQDAHVEGGKLVGDTATARQILKTVGPATHIRGDRFRGRTRRNVPRRAKPTSAQQRARSANIRKAQKARRRSRA
jgi:hypothetical protein